MATPTELNKIHQQNLNFFDRMLNELEEKIALVQEQRREYINRNHLNQNGELLKPGNEDA